MCHWNLFFLETFSNNVTVILNAVYLFVLQWDKVEKLLGAKGQHPELTPCVNSSTLLLCCILLNIVLLNIL